MKANFKLISTVLIIFLTVLLIVILISYYNAPVEVNDYSSKNFANTNQEVDKVISDDVSGEIVTNIKATSGEVIIESGDLSGEVKVETNTIPVLPSSGKEEPKKDQVIITSEDTMTNKEKREILTQLDNTLMELLDVVDKVQTVDESRLITEEGEVQK